MKNNIYIRPLTQEDGETSYTWRNDARVWAYTRFKPGKAISKAAECLWIQNSSRRTDVQRFAICLDDDGKYIGNVQLTDIREGRAEFHIFIGEPEYWGRGIGQQATAKLLRHAFEKLNLDCVYLSVKSEHAAARMLYERAGFHITGLKDDEILMEITNNDYLVNQSGELGVTHRVTEAGDWRAWLSRADSYDFYHTHAYHQLHGHNGEALLFVYEENNDFVGIPFIKRNIPDTDLSDLTSVYGYAGPFSTLLGKPLDAGFSARFRNAFLKFAKDEQVVTVFSGLNPFMDHSALLSAIGGVCENGKIVVMDLSNDQEYQRQQYRKGVSRKIRIIRDKCWVVKQAQGEDAIRTFTAIYGATMERLHAAAGYQFNGHYISALLDSKEFDARLMFVHDENNYPVCGAIVVITGEIMQAHLLGTREAFRHASPAKLLTEELTVLGRKLGLKYFNLGGGLGFREDSLFDWKRNFSSLTLNYKTWRYVVDENLYEMIVTNAGIDRNDHIDFFPLYRAEFHTFNI